MTLYRVQIFLAMAVFLKETACILKENMVEFRLTNKITFKTCGTISEFDGRPRPAKNLTAGRSYRNRARIRELNALCQNLSNPDH